MMSKKLFFIVLLLMAFSLSFAQTVFNESFETGNTAGSAPVGWTCDTGGWFAGNGTQTYNRGPRSGTWYAYLQWSRDKWIYKSVDLTAGMTYNFSMWYKSDGVAGTSFEVKWGSSADASSMTQNIVPVTPVLNTDFVNATAQITPTATGTYFIGIHGIIPTSSPWYLTIDDVSLFVPVNNDIAVQSISSSPSFINAGSQVALNATLYNNGLLPQNNQQVNFLIDGNIVNTQTFSLNPGQNTVLTTNWTAVIGQHTYSVTVANDNDNSNNTQSSSFRVYPSTYLLESFENTVFPPAGWSIDPTPLWTRSTSYPYAGTASAYLYNSSTAITDQKLMTPKLQIANGDNFSYYAKTSSTTSPSIRVMYSPDKVTWTAIGETNTLTTNYTGFNVDLSSIPGNYYLALAVTSTGTYQATYVDMVIMPQILPEVPGPATYTAPLDAALNISALPTFTWANPTTGGVPTGYKLYIGTDGAGTTTPTNFLNGQLITGNSYQLASILAYNTMYYWQLVATNSMGDAVNSPIWSFTTMPNPTISVFPYLEDFSSTTFPPMNWTRRTGLLANPTAFSSETSSWISDDFGNVTDPLNKSARVNIYSTGCKYWLVTPPIDLGTAGVYQLEFDMALTDYASPNPITSDPNGTTGIDDKFAVIISTDNGITWSSANTLRLWDNVGSPYVYNSISNVGEHCVLNLTQFTGTVKIGFYGESLTSNADNDFFVDNVQVRQAPTTPQFAVAPIEKLFGSVQINSTTPAQNFVISNNGTGQLGVNTIELTGADAGQFILTNTNTLPALVEGGAPITVSVAFSPTSIGDKTASLVITDAMTRTVHTIPLSGTGYDGSISAFPYLEDFSGATFPPLEWTRFAGLLAAPSVLTPATSYWISDDFCNVTDPVNKSARINIYSTTYKHWLVTPTINIGTTTDYQLEFDLALTDYANSNPITSDPNGTTGIDDKFAVIISTDNGTTWTSANTLRLWDNAGSSYVYNNISATGEHIIINLSQYSGNIKIAFYGESTVSNADNDLFVDNVQIRVSPTSPLFAVTPTEKNFGVTQINMPSAPQNFSISNNGIGQLGINSIQITGPDAAQFELTNTNALPAQILSNQSITVSVKFIPTSLGAKTASLVITDNLTRTAHSIALSGLGSDATIVTFPYTENFDTVTIPALPFGWLKIVNSTNTSAYVNSYTGTLANSAPNAARLYNSADATASLLLITPPIQNTNTKRVKFFAKGGVGYSLEIGYITNPLEDSTFVTLQTINPPTAYTQYLVSLAAAPAGLQRVAFRHGLGATSRTIYIDDVIFENLPTTSEITVSTEPIDFGNIYQYLPASNQIIISNTGILPLTINWTLPANVSINPPGNTTVNPGINTTINVIINAQNQGTFSGNLVLNTNDPAHTTVTIPITANVLPPLPPGLIEIGSGDVISQNMPWEPYYRYTYTQTIYTGSQLVNTGGPRITELNYHFNGFSAFTDSIRVYIGYTNLNEFPTNTSWVPYDSLSLVYDGQVSTEAQDSWVNIVLQNPFFYTPGRNIVIGVHEYLAGNYHTNSDEFFCTLTTTNKSLNYYNDTTNPNPMSPPSGTLKTYIPNTRILFGSPQVPPMNLQALIGNGTVTLTWLAPQLGDDNVRNQKIERNNINENYSFSSNSSRTTNDRISLVNYKVYRNNTEIAFLPTTELSFTDTGLVNGITYTYYVTGIYLDPDGESGPSNIIQVIPDGSILNPPVNLTSQLSENNVSLNWQNGLFTLSEGFENQGIPVNWNSCDVDGDENNWFTFTNAPHTGGQCIASASYTAELGALNPNNWLVSTPINVGNNAYLYWWVAGQDPAHLGDQYKVYISTVGNDFSDFGASSFTEIVNSTTWARKQLSLEAFAGQTIWVAFAHQNSPNHSILKLDDVVVVSAITTTQNLPSKTINTNNSKKDNQSINNKICLNNQASHKVVTNNSRVLTGYKVYRNDQPVAQTEPEVFTFMDQLTTSGEYTYYVTTLYSEGESEPSNVMTVNITENNDVIVTPLVTALKRNYPNPFNPETSIAFDLASAGNVEINIYNAKGQKVKTLISEFKNPGSYKAVWNGKDSNNQNCGSGIYFYKMKSGKYTSTGKMILMK